MAEDYVAIVDSGGANIASLQFALDRLGANSQLTADPAVVVTASHVIVPGVGAAAAAIDRLRAHKLDKLLTELRQPVLGICLGMQLFASRSEENEVACLGIVPDHAVKLVASPEQPVPNMGWCQLRQVRPSPLMDGIAPDSWFYFVHSFAIPVSERTVCTATHTEEFSAVLAYRNFYATQFHPERSSQAGARILQNFLDIAA